MKSYKIFKTTKVEREYETNKNKIRATNRKQYQIWQTLI